MPPHPTSWRPILLLSSPSTPWSSKWSLSLRFSHQTHVKVILLLIQSFNQGASMDKRPVNVTAPNKTLCFRIRLNQIGLYLSLWHVTFLKPIILYNLSPLCVPSWRKASVDIEVKQSRCIWRVILLGCYAVSSSNWLRIVQRIEVLLFARPNSLIRPFWNSLTLKFKALQTITMCNSKWPKVPGELNLHQHR